MYPRLEKALRERGMSRLKLACRMSISASDLSSAMNGKKPMYPKYRQLISEILDIPEEELFEEAGK